MACSYEALSPYTREPGTGGPTNTFTTQRQFARALRGVLSRINARIREAVDENDLFGLRNEALVDDVPENVFETSSRRTAILGFLNWLRNQLDENYLEVVGPDRNEFIRSAYATGLRNAQDQLSDLDVSFARVGADELLSRPIHRTALQTLYTRAYGNLESVRDDLVQDVRDTLVEGFQEGEGPREIARTLTSRVDSIGKHRSTLIARSETINAHTESVLTRLDEIERDRPGEPSLSVAHGQWDAANDARTCPFCMALDGVPLTTNDARNTQVRVQSELPGEISQVGQTFRLAPPAHPSCRCGVRVMVGSEVNTPLSERLPNEVTQL